MKNTVKRFYQEYDNPYVEVIVYGLAGTSGIELDDPRCKPIGQEIDGLDNWLILSISNAAYKVPQLPYNYSRQTVIDPDTLEAVIVEVPTTPILGDDFFNSPYWTPYDNPLRDGVTLIDESSFWRLQSDKAKAKRAKDQKNISGLGVEVEGPQDKPKRS